MVTVTVADGELVAHVEGLSEQISAWRSSVRVPLDHVQGAEPAGASVSTEISVAEGTELFHPAGPQTRVGTFDDDDDEGKSFWDVKNPVNAVVIHLTDENFDRLVVEVADPAATIALVNASAKGAAADPGVDPSLPPSGDTLPLTPATTLV